MLIFRGVRVVGSEETNEHANSSFAERLGGTTPVDCVKINQRAPRLAYGLIAIPLRWPGTCVFQAVLVRVVSALTIVSFPRLRRWLDRSRCLRTSGR